MCRALIVTTLREYLCCMHQRTEYIINLHKCVKTHSFSDATKRAKSSHCCYCGCCSSRCHTAQCSYAITQFVFFLCLRMLYPHYFLHVIGVYIYLLKTYASARARSLSIFIWASARFLFILARCMLLVVFFLPPFFRINSVQLKRAEPEEWMRAWYMCFVFGFVYSSFAWEMTLGADIRPRA